MTAIRFMAKDDFDAILPLQREIADLHVNGRPDMFRAGHLNFDRERFDAFLGTEGRFGLLAEEDGAAVGFAFVLIREVKNHPTLMDFRQFYIDDICVRSDRKRRGIGRMLFGECEKLAREHGCDRITLDVHSFNEDAIRFYEAMGFAPRKIQMERTVKHGKEA